MLSVHQQARHAQAALAKAKDLQTILLALEHGTIITAGSDPQGIEDAIGDSVNMIADMVSQLTYAVNEMNLAVEREDDAEMYGPKITPRHRGVFDRLTGEAA